MITSPLHSLIPEDFEIKEFKPFVEEIPALGLTVMLLEDTTIVWEPCKLGRPGHSVDLGYNNKGELVGIQIWDNVKYKKK